MRRERNSEWAELETWQVEVAARSEATLSKL